MNSTIGVLIGLAISIVLILRKISPVYSLILGALTGGILSGWGLVASVDEMITGVKDIAPAILRILAAGVLSGMLVVTGAATRISSAIINGLGEKRILLSLALSAMVLTAMGVFIDVAVITIAPIAIMAGNRTGLSRAKLLLAMIGGGKCGNIISPNPNTIIAADNFGAPLPSVMAAGIIPALIGLIITVYVIVPLAPCGQSAGVSNAYQEDNSNMPSLWSSLVGPFVSILLLALRPIFGIIIDPMIALPAGGLIGIICTGNWKSAGKCLSFGLEKMSVIAVLLIGTGALAGIIKASDIKDSLISLLSGWEGGAAFLAPISGILMSAASASTTAGATIASASFAQAILAAGIPAIWGAAMTNAGATVLDHLPHGSFFHATGGCVEMGINERLKLIPFESLIGLFLSVGVASCYFIFGY